MMFRSSADGGKTWSNERTMNAGAVGKYKARAYLTRLGKPRMWVPEVSVSDPIPWRVIDAYLNNNAAQAA